MWDPRSLSGLLFGGAVLEGEQSGQEGQATNYAVKPKKSSCQASEIKASGLELRATCYGGFLFLLYPAINNAWILGFMSYSTYFSSGTDCQLWRGSQPGDAVPGRK